MAAIPAPVGIDDTGCTEGAIDHERLQHVLFRIIKTFGEAGSVDPSSITDVQFSDHPVIKALNYADIFLFTELLALGPDAIKDLHVPPYTIAAVPGGPGVLPVPAVHYPATPLHGKWTRKLRTLVAYYHHESRKSNRPIDIRSATSVHFDRFRIGEYAPDEAIVPWNRKTDSSATALANWKKNMKPTMSAYKKFDDEALWSKAKQRMINTLESQGLLHMIDPGYVVVNKELDQHQNGWLYKVFEETFTHPMAKTIITAHAKEKDVRSMWQDLVTYYDSSMAASIRSQKHSSYITSTRLDTASWRGTISSYLLHFKEQIRLYEETSDQPYTDMQKIQFMQNALAGTTELNCVCRQNSAAARAAGIKKPITFEEYFQMLLEVANVLDAGRTFQHNPRRKQNVNVMEIILDDDEEDDQYATLESNVHSHQDEQWDQDTTLEQLEMYLTERPARNDNRSNNSRPRNDRPPSNRPDRPPSNRPERVFMDNPTWAKITPEDRKSWLRVSEQGKLAILEYGSVRKNGFQSSGAGSKPPGGAPSSRRTTNTHELEFEDTPGTHNETDATPLEAKTHERNGSTTDSTSDSDTKTAIASFNGKRQTDKIQGLLHMATHTSDASSGNIAQVLS